jgi:hypothetical protein
MQPAYMKFPPINQYAMEAVFPDRSTAAQPQVRGLIAHACNDYDPSPLLDGFVFHFFLFTSAR